MVLRLALDGGGQAFIPEDTDMTHGSTNGGRVLSMLPRARPIRWLPCLPLALAVGCQDLAPPQTWQGLVAGSPSTCACLPGTDPCEPDLSRCCEPGCDPALDGARICDDVAWLGELAQGSPSSDAVAIADAVIVALTPAQLDHLVDFPIDQITQQTLETDPAFIAAGEAAQTRAEALGCGTLRACQSGIVDRLATLAAAFVGTLYGQTTCRASFPTAQGQAQCAAIVARANQAVYDALCVGSTEPEPASCGEIDDACTVDADCCGADTIYENDQLGEASRRCAAAENVCEICGMTGFLCFGGLDCCDGFSCDIETLECQPD